MKSVWKHVLIPLAAVVSASCGAVAQTTTSSTVNPDLLAFNHGPCDFNDAYYQGNPGGGTQPDGTLQFPGNGISVTMLDTPQAQRFGLFRQFGPPATGQQANWVVDATCSQDDPTRKNIRILAATGGYPDASVTFGEQQGGGQSTQFISIIAFLQSQSFFTGVANARNLQMIDIVGNFEAYGAPKQIVNGTFQGQPCGSMSTNGSPAPVAPAPPQPTTPLTTNCFPVTSVATPNLRQDWRFATNRNSIDGSNNNDPFGCLGVGSGTPNPACPLGANLKKDAAQFGNVNGQSSPFGYFCDDLLGMWIVTYFWFPINPNTVDPTSVCGQQYALLAAQNGKSLDGSPIVKTGDDLNNTLEAFTQDKGPGAGLPCAQEGQLDTSGVLDFPGAVWIICPTIPDPRNGAIAKDAFLDQVKLPNGRPLDPEFNAVFNCLQTVGQYPTITGPGTGEGGPITGVSNGGGTVTHSTGSNGQPITVTCAAQTGNL